MSDEPNPPSLRLKPRQPSISATPVTPPPPPEAPASPAPPPVVSAPMPPVTPAVASTGDESDLLRLRLKPKTPAPEPTPAPASISPFSTPPVAAAPASVSPNPVAATPPPAVAKSAPPPVSARPPTTVPKPSYVPTPRNLTEPVVTPQEPSAPPTIKADKWLAGIVLVVLVAVGIFYGIPHLTKSSPKKMAVKDPAPQAAAPTPAPATEPAPDKSKTKPAAKPEPKPKLVDKPVSAAGKQIAKARDVAAANDLRQQGLDGVMGEEAASAAGTTTPDAATVPTSAVPGTILEPAASAVPAVPLAPPPPPPPTTPFKQFVINMRVSGVFQGENARAMLNGKMVHPGDVVNEKLAITLFKIDVDNKQLIFKDDTGATVSRRY